MMKKTFFLFASAIFASAVMAQVAVEEPDTLTEIPETPVMTFTEKRHNFGQIQEAIGQITHEFTFTNDGAETLVIKNIRPSCDWITTTVSDSIIEPGDFGTATVTYHTAGHLGKFAKTITFTTNAEDSVSRLFVLGDVLPKSLLKVGSYPYRIGPLSTKRADADFGILYKGDTAQIVIEYANSTEKPIELDVLAPAKQKFITINVSRKQLAPNEEGVITIKFYPDLCRIWGQFNAKLSVLTNGVNDKNNDIKLSATIEEDFSKLTPEELEAAPIFALEDTVFDMGKVRAGKELSKKIVFKNGGKNPLEIRRLQVMGGKMLKVAPEEKGKIEGGKKNTLICDITTPRKTKKSKQYKRTLFIITNDPNHVYNNIVVKWTVEP